MVTRAMTLVCSLAAIATLLVACGEDRDKGSVEESGGTTATMGTSTTRTTTAPAAGGPVVASVEVKETEYRLDPGNPRVAKAGVVSFRVRNAGKITHALEVEGPGGEVQTRELAPGASATLRADLSKPGTYEWYCPLDGHKDRGMKGTITVAGGGSSPGEDDSGMHDDAGKGGGRSGGDDSGGGGGSGKGGGAGGGGSGVY